MSFEEENLVRAIKANNLQEVQNLLNSGTAQTYIRDKDGKTLLHVALENKASADILKHLLDVVDIGLRDKNGNTAAELAFSEDSHEDIKEVMTNFLKGLILGSKLEKLHKLALAGWSVWPVQAEHAKNISTELGEFIEKLADFQGKVAGIHKAIQDDNLREVKNLLDRKILAQAADRTGLPPLHKAVVLGQTEIALYMANEYKDALNLKDNMGRTPLHYAGGSHEAGHLYEELTKAGADDTITDLSGNTPKEYFDDPTLLSVMDVRKNILEILERPLINVQREKSATRKIHQLYISTELKRKDVPPPTTVDGKYVAQHLGTALTLALAEIAERRPWDPIEYLGQWLHKYGENQKYVKRQEELLEQIRLQEEQREQEIEHKKRIKAEQMELQEMERKQREKEEEERKKREQEELQRKAKEAALAQRPNLETVAEEGELEETSNKDKDVYGQTELHKLAAQQGADVASLIKLGYSIADRDANNKTPRDIAQDNKMEENVQAIDAYVQDLIENENFDVIEQLMLDGYDHLHTVLEKQPLQPKDGDTQESNNFVLSIIDLQEKLKSVLTASHYSNIDTIKQVVETSKLAKAKDQFGRCPLHIAVLADQKEIVDHIVTTFPESVNAKDNMCRTPLHYAMALSEEIAAVLTSHGADSEAKDMNNRTPDYYKSNPDDIKSLRHTAPSTSDNTAEGQGQTQEQDESQGQTQVQDDDSQQKTDSSSDEQQSQQESGEQQDSGEQQQAQQEQSETVQE